MKQAAVLLLPLLLLPAAASALVFEMPLSAGGNLFDLGEPPSRVQSVQVVVDVSIVPLTWDCGGDPVETPYMFSIRLFDKNGTEVSEFVGVHATTAVSTVIDLEPLAADWSKLSQTAGNLDLGGWIPSTSFLSCTLIDIGGLTFGPGMLLRIVYEGVVPEGDSTWGEVKALYR